jgi:hypothetical protein
MNVAAKIETEELVIVHVKPAIALLGWFTM